MRRLLIVIAVVVCLPFVLLLATGLILKSIVSGDASEAALQKLNERLPVEVSTTGGEFDLARWFRLQPAIALNGVVVANPKGFSGEPMIEADKVSVEVDLFPLLSHELRVQRVVVLDPTVRVETNAQGQTNLAALAPTGGGEGATPEGGEAGGGLDLAVDGVYLQNGTVTFSEPSGAYDFLRVSGLNVALTDFTPDSRFRLRLDGDLFGGDVSKLSFDGFGGPFKPEAWPAEGALEVTIASEEIPENYRVRQFGNLLRYPGKDSTLGVQAKMAGDLMKQISGTGLLRFSKFQLGRDADHRLPLDGEAPLRLRVDNPLGAPSIHVSTDRASLQLGEGELNSALDVALNGGNVRGSLAGSLKGVNIDQILSAFSESAGQVYGLASITGFELKFAGSSGRALVDSLDGKAEIHLDKGRLTFMNTFERVVSTAGTLLQAQRALQSGQALPSLQNQSDETPFTTLFSNLRLGSQTATLADIALDSPAGKLTGGGSFTFDGALNFNLVAHMTGDVATALMARTNTGGEAEVSIPFEVTGTFDAPKVRPNVSSLVKGAAVSILERLLSGSQGKNTEQQGESGTPTP